LARNWVGFVIRYCAGKQFYGKGGRRIWDTKGASYMDELRENTQDVILRRRKDDVLNLPEKIVQPIYLPLRNKMEYQRIVGEYQSWAEHQKNVNLAMHLAELVKLRQFLAMSKIESTIEIAENAIEEGKKVVIFTNFTEPLLQMFYHFGKQAVIHHGPMTKANREESIERFQNDPDVQVFIGNIVSAGIGITLTAGELVIFNDLSWLPADHLQAQDRCYREGTTKKVNVYYNIIDGSLDLHLYHHLMKKIKIIDQVMGDSNLDESIFQSVLQKLKK
jgi:SWI/SNF-related matrix-associated actin-dependent regulator 1 of chromatin subfamily A